MKANEYIKEIQKLVDKYGNLDLFIPEGESYSVEKVEFAPCAGFYDNSSGMFTDIEESPRKINGIYVTN